MTDDAGIDEFSSEEQHTLSAVLDEIIPPSRERGMPGAGEIGLVAAIGTAARTNPALRASVAQCVARLDELARERGADRFAAAAPAQRAALFQSFAAEEAGFIPSLAFALYTNYYQHPRVLEALGLEARPPFPKGHAMEPFDESLLDGVRRRSRMYRDC